MLWTGAVAALLAAGAAQAQQVLIGDLSFGYQGRLSPESNGKIPNFAVQGDNRQPQLLSNKVILTPVAPGNQRASIWSDKTLEETEWVTDVDLRATGPERGGGNLNIWLAKDGSKQIGQGSVYTVGKFEGLALVIDAHGGSGGMLRAFLNDGTVDFGARQSVDELAFGHCLYPYRNLGRPSQVKMRQTRDIFKVEIDGQLCFESDKVAIPRGYNLGITAATPDNPDSFEIFKMVVLSDRQASSSNTNNENGNNNNNNNNNKGGDSKYSSRMQQPPKRAFTPEDGGSEEFDEMIDEDADIFQTSRTQFQDLHNRLQSTNHQLSSVYRSVSRHHQLDEQRHTEIKNMLLDMRSDLAQLEQVEAMRKRIDALEGEIRGMRNDLGRKIRDNERNFKGYLTDHHATLSQTLVDSMPSHKKLIAIFIFTQIALVVLYIVYKTRKANSPKKYL